MQKEEEYSATEKDVQNLQKQIEINNQDGKTLMDKWKGDLYQATLDAFKLSDGDTSVLYERIDWDLLLNNDTLGIENETNTSNALEKARVIADEKDAIYKDNREDTIDITNAELFEYIAFTYNTDIYIRKKVNSTRHTIENDIFLNYLDNNRIEESTGKHNKMIIKYLGGKSKKLYKRWALESPAIIYLSYQIVKLDKNNNPDDGEEIPFYNKLGTRLLEKAKYINDKQVLVGPCIVVNKWFQN